MRLRNSTPACIVAATFCLAWMLTASPALACPIPVFQYSLEHWDADPYDVIVHHHGPLTDEQQAVVKILQAIEQGEGDTIANITVILRDHAELNSRFSAGDPPRVEVRYPMVSGLRTAVWVGELKRESLMAVIDSPVRQKIAQHLIDRDAAVWVLLESGHEEADEKALLTLQRELPRMEKTLKVPDPEEEFGIDLGDIHTEIDFTIVRLRRDDPKEKMFIAMLLGIERDLKDYEDKPLAFPIYGRGLMMYALIGDGINARTLNAAGEFLVGPCSCQVKSGNPGVDVLMAVNWDDKVERQTDLGIAGPAGGDGFFDRLDADEDQ